jgi:peroxiredoxin family protein
MKEVRMPQVDELITLAKELGVKLIACTTTMAVMGIGKDAFIPEVDTFTGAATFVGEAKDSKINLFI